MKPNEKNIRSFIKIIEELSVSRARREVFSDFLTFSMCFLDLYKKGLKDNTEYKGLHAKYSIKENKNFLKLFTILTAALELEKEDFLGNIYSGLNLSDTYKQQYFTPTSVCRLMADVQFDTKNLDKNRIYTINDPCCGAGGLLIAVIDKMMNDKFPYQQNALFVAEDIDNMCASMTYVQLSLLGASALVACKDTMTNKTYWTKGTPFYYLTSIKNRYKIQCESEKENTS